MVGTPGGNVYLRLSLMRPRAGEAAHVGEILDELARYYAGLPGFIEGFTLVESAKGEEVGRVGMWRSEADAEHAANQQHVMVLRAELMRVVEPGSHLEKSFTAEGRQAAESTARSS